MVRAERAETYPVPRDALWELLCDTDRLNRELNLPAVRYTFQGRAEGGSHLRAAARRAGVLFRWDEEPYRWARPGFWSVRRRFDNGPLAEFEVAVHLDDIPSSSTTVRVLCAVAPRGVAGRPIARRFVQSGVDGIHRACAAFVAHLQDAERPAYPGHAGVPPADHARLDAAAQRLRGLDADPQISERLTRLLADAPLEDALELRPFALADRWGFARTEILQTCLLAVQAGMLELRWRLLCPACLGPGDSASSLDALTRGEAHCPSCDIRFGPAFDRDVEVCFSVAPAIRPHDGSAGRYCVGGPGNSAHRVLQWLVAPGASETVPHPLPAGRYRVASPQMRQPQPLELVEAGGAALIFSPEPGAFVHLAPTSGPWTIQNRAPFPVLVRIEAPQRAVAIATAAAVTSLGAFRGAFGSEVLSPGAELAVRQLAFLFTDLKDSTALYGARGDAPSYAAVRDHFGVLTGTIEGNRGGVLKTMGDAILAVFADPADAVRAALAIQRDAPARLGGLTVKIGIHAGPALAVNSSGALDYFGQTVNVAARIQSHSRGGDIVLTEALAADPVIAPLLADLPRDGFVAELKGATAECRLVRLHPTPAAPLEVRPLAADDREWARALWRESWGGETMATRGVVLHIDDLPGFVAWRAGERVGLATCHHAGGETELTSLDSLQGGAGIGGALLSAVEDAARAAGSGRVFCITTNDNLHALRFYQRRGWRLCALRPGAIDAARADKPEIPEIGAAGIPLRDELELEKRFPGSGPPT